MKRKPAKTNSLAIEMPSPQKIFLKNLVTDPDNPNEMSTEQEQALDALMKRYGFLSPVVVGTKDRKGKQIIHNGEHRVKKLLAAGNTWTWGYVKKLSSLDHRMLRQGMNKTHGEHEATKDALEIAAIQKKGMLSIFATLIGQPEELLEVNQEVILATKDADMMDYRKNNFLEGNLKQLYFMFDNKQYEKIMPRIEKIMAHMKVDNNTDMFVGLLDCYEDYILKKKR